jgi:pimeloyl-ACP methyl ester carboxylesterase
MPRTDRSQFYMLYFQEPGVAEAEFERDPRHTIRTLLFSGSGDALPRHSDGTPDTAPGMVPCEGGFLSRRGTPGSLPGWLTEADVDFYAGEFARTGFRGGLNWYRNIDRDWELMAPFAGLKIAVPALYLAGDRDSVVAWMGRERIDSLPKFVPNLRKTIMLSGCGHWTQQECAAEVNAALLEFLRDV